jgi:mono/diheme cytochrome c family protein
MRCRSFIFASAAALSAAGVIYVAHAAADQPAPQTEQANNTQQANNNDAGKHVFMQARCFACHGEYGFGGVGPRFRENRFLGMGDYVVGQILIGRGIMPSFAKALDDNQIAQVASYIRNSWGNQFGPVKADDVANVRQKIQLHPPPDRPHLPPAMEQSNAKPMPPNKSLPPGQALPPQQE